MTSLDRNAAKVADSGSDFHPGFSQSLPAG